MCKESNRNEDLGKKTKKQILPKNPGTNMRLPRNPRKIKFIAINPRKVKIVSRNPRNIKFSSKRPEKWTFCKKFLRNQDPGKNSQWNPGLGKKSKGTQEVDLKTNQKQVVAKESKKTLDLKKKILLESRTWQEISVKPSFWRNM